jgi:hypothetical protein
MMINTIQIRKLMKHDSVFKVKGQFLPPHGTGIGKLPHHKSNCLVHKIEK